MKSNQISIKEIAKLCDVSVATVSRVINNNGRFSEETRKKVLDVIEKYQYSTNTVAKTLRMNKSKTIGIIVPDISNEFFSTIVHEIESYFFDRGFSTFICNTDKSKEKEMAYITSLDSKMVDGLICISGQEEIEASLLSRDIPIVTIDRRPRMTNNLAMIESDHFNGGYLATKHLIDRGCKSIIVLTKKSNLSSVNDRVEGFKKALAEHSYPFTSHSIVETADDRKHNIEKARNAIHEELKNGRTFDGVFATNDWLALGVVRELLDSNLKVPEDVKVVGFDDDTIANYSEIPLTTIRQDVHKIAEVTSELFYNLLTEENAVINKKHIKIPVELIVRKTT
ncbi:LacI family transcriptional regulator [Robertmurraya siralis]|uniref:LacI family transcriptional regulator n=1 Tax=Robertmurraya siralis TaxID=77777 RepID=A0A920BV96_9BACI|nr:LacI family DNA-binding transcriptional regulator [Robertmurraya siralis]GIN63336.1 LacI family transcriptional regulator [Robertmurraya siralis]